jgi:hypothetical protein
MRHIERLRSAKNRVGPELSNGRRESELIGLDVEVGGALDAELAAEHGCCMDMRDTIAKMQARVADLRRRTSVSSTATADSSQSARRIIGRAWDAVCRVSTVSASNLH